MERSYGRDVGELLSEIGALIASILLQHSGLENYLLSVQRKVFSVRAFVLGLLETRTLRKYSPVSDLLKQVKQALNMVLSRPAAGDNIHHQQRLLRRALVTLGEVEKSMQRTADINNISAATRYNLTSSSSASSSSSTAIISTLIPYSPATPADVVQPRFISLQLNESHPILTCLRPAADPDHDHLHNNIVSIVGAGGVGKTTFLVHLLLHLQSSHAFSFVAFIELLHDHPNDEALLRAQASLLMQLGCPVKKLKSLIHGRVALKERIQDLATMGKSFCIAIDNVWRAQDLKNLLSDVLSPSTASSCIIITSRIRTIADDLEDVCARNVPSVPFQSIIHEKEPLQFDAAKNLLLAQVSHMGPFTYEHEMMLDDICTYCEGIPLVLKAVGGLLAHAKLDEWEAYKRNVMGATTWISLADNSVHLQGLFKTSYNNLHRSSQEALWDIASFLHGWPWDSVQTIVGVEEMKELTSFHIIKPVNRQLLASKVRYHTDGDVVVTMHDFIRKQALTSERTKDWGTMGLSTWLSSDKQFLKVVKHLHLDIDTMQEKAVAPTLPVLGSCFSLMERLTVFDLCGTFQCGIAGPKLLLPTTLLYLKLTHNNLTKDLSTLQVPSSLRQFELEHYEELLELPPSIYECKDLRILRILACPVLHGFWFISNWHRLRALHLEACNGITQLPEDLKDLELLALHDCQNLQPLPWLPSKKVVRMSIKGCPYLSVSAQEHKAAKVIHGKSSVQLEEVDTEVDHLYGLEDSPIHLCGNVQKLSAASVRLRLRNCTCRKLDGLGFEEMTGLRKMKLQFCPNLVRLPNSICKLKSLTVLDLRGCSALEQLPLQLDS